RLQAAQLLASEMPQAKSCSTWLKPGPVPIRIASVRAEVRWPALYEKAGHHPSHARRLAVKRNHLGLPLPPRPPHPRRRLPLCVKRLQRLLADPPPRPPTGLVPGNVRRAQRTVLNPSQNVVLRRGVQLGNLLDRAPVHGGPPMVC